jgi:hypothetical protein
MLFGFLQSLDISPQPDLWDGPMFRCSPAPFGYFANPNQARSMTFVFRQGTASAVPR